MDADAQLLAAWRDGDARAGNALLARHFDALYRFFWNKVDEPDELVQQTLWACVDSRERIESESFRPFLFSVARHRLQTHWNKTRRQRERIDFGTVSAVDLGPSPSQAMAEHTQRRVLLQALRTISVDDQMIVELHYWEAMTGPALARAMGVPEGTVRSRLRRARLALRRAFDAMLEASGTDDSLDSGFEGWEQRLREYGHRELQSEPS